MDDKPKISEDFKKIILEYLEKRAREDELFANTLKKENKNIDECCNYILNQVQNSGLNGFTDTEIFGMAVHYYDEDSIKDVKESAKCTIITNHFHELTEEEIKKAKEDAIRKLIEEEKMRLKKRPEKSPTVSLSKSDDPDKKKPENPKFVQQSLF